MANSKGITLELYKKTYVVTDIDCFLLKDMGIYILSIEDTSDITAGDRGLLTLKNVQLLVSVQVKARKAISVKDMEFVDG